jgi:hypothetical protein
MTMNGDAQAGEVKVTGSMLGSLRSTKPWTQFLAILGFVGVGLMVLVGAAVTFFASMVSQQKNGPTAFLGLFYLVFAALYFMPALYLYKYSSSLGNFLKSNGAGDLECALAHQKSFWKFTGIVALIGIGLSVLAIAAAVIIPIMAKMRM